MTISRAASREYRPEGRLPAFERGRGGSGRRERRRGYEIRDAAPGRRFVRLALLCSVLSALPWTGPLGAAGETCGQCDLDWMRCRQQIQVSQDECGRQRPDVCRAKCEAAGNRRPPPLNQDPVWLASCVRTCTAADEACDQRFRREAVRCTAVRGLCRQRSSCER